MYPYQDGSPSLNVWPTHKSYRHPELHYSSRLCLFKSSGHTVINDHNTKPTRNMGKQHNNDLGKQVLDFTLKVMVEKAKIENMSNEIASAKKQK